MRRYEAVMDLVRRQVEAGALRTGDRMPSIRMMAARMGCSAITVQHAYGLLESAGEIRSHPRSGFFVAQPRRSPAEFTDDPGLGLPAEGRPVSVDELAFRVAAPWQRDGQGAFGAALPSPDLFDRVGLHRQLARVLRQTVGRAGDAGGPEGDPLLREAIARRVARRGVVVSPEEVVVTGDGMAGLNLCLDVLTEPGDVVLVESPSFFPLLAALQRRRLRALEIYSHPRHGVDPDQFEHLLRTNQVRTGLMMPVHHHPTGITYSEEVMRRIVAAATRHGVPIVECDLYGELSHREEVTPSLKRFDPEDMVLQFGSFASTLAPGYGLGWVLGGRYRRRLVEHQFLNGMVSGDGMRQRAVAEYIQQRSHDRRLKALRATLAARMRQGLELVAQLFPTGCAASRPSGGFMCWVRGPRDFDALAASRRALRMGISLAPGPMFSVTRSFDSFVGLNLSFAWNTERLEQFRMVAEILSEDSRRIGVPYVPLGSRDP
jgi:DNA-binding transcriptional MocR family regulator